MSRFGRADAAFGSHNRYRVIWSESRYRTYHLDSGPLTVRIYNTCEPVSPPCWILEKWLSPAEIYPGTEEQWNRDPVQLATGPYPKDGEYFLSGVFSHIPTTHSVETIIKAIEEGQKRRPIENQLACRGNMEKDVKDRKNTQLDMIDNLLRPFGGGESFVGYGGGRNSKTMPELLSAEQVGLTAPGAMKVRK